MIERSPRNYAGWCGLANAGLGFYVLAVIVYFCATQGWPAPLEISVAVLGLIGGGASMAIAGAVVFSRSRLGSPVQRALGATALLGLPAGLGSGVFYGFMIHSLLTRGFAFGRPPDVEMVVAMGAFVLPLPINVATCMVWLLFRGRIDGGGADATTDPGGGTEPLHG